MVLSPWFRDDFYIVLYILKLFTKLKREKRGREGEREKEREEPSCRAEKSDLRDSCQTNKKQTNKQTKTGHSEANPKKGNMALYRIV